MIEEAKFAYSDIGKAFEKQKQLKINEKKNEGTCRAWKTTSQI